MTEGARVSFEFHWAFSSKIIAVELDSFFECRLYVHVCSMTYVYIDRFVEQPRALVESMAVVYTCLHTRVCMCAYVYTHTAFDQIFLWLVRCRSCSEFGETNSRSYLDIVKSARGCVQLVKDDRV